MLSASRAVVGRARVLSGHTSNLGPVRFPRRVTAVRMAIRPTIRLFAADTASNRNMRDRHNAPRSRPRETGPVPEEGR